MISHYLYMRRDRREMDDISLPIYEAGSERDG